MMEMFSYEVPLGSIGNIKTGDTIEQGVIKEIHFVGLNESKMVVTGLCEASGIVSKVYGKSVNSGEESGWIERQLDKNKFNINIDEINYKLQEGLDKHSEKVKKAKEKLDDEYSELIKKKQAPTE